MSEHLSENTQAENIQEQQRQTVKVHVSPDLDYSFKDVANIYVGNGDVVFEFGNHHRSMPGNVSITDRIVLTTSAAYELQQQLQKALMQAQQQMQAQLQAQMQNK